MYDSMLTVLLVGNPLETPWWAIYGPFETDQQAREFAKDFTVPYTTRPVLGMKEWIKHETL